jgi:lipoprotein-releasing system ATP-binding protein
MSEQPLLVAENLHKSYTLGKRLVEVLQGVNLTVNRGEFHALRGASGAGKSTLLHLLGGLDTPNSGEIFFEGNAFSKFTSKQLTQFRNQKVGFIFQAYHLLPELDALENVSLPARMAREDARKVEKRARGILERVGLSERLEHRPYELSGGEQQRVSIARSLMNNPVLILADEPTGNLDSHTGHGIIDLLLELQKERQATLIIATHDATLAARAPQVVEIVDGLVANGGPPAAPPAKID